MKNFKLLPTIALTTMAAAASFNSSAALIDGSVQFFASGTFLAIDGQNFSATTIDLADGIDFGAWDGDGSGNDGPDYSNYNPYAPNNNSTAGTISAGAATGDLAAAGLGTNMGFGSAFMAGFDPYCMTNTGCTGTIADLMFDPANTELDPFIQFTHFNNAGDSFKVVLHTIVDVTGANQSDRLDLAGTATISLTGFEDTSATWTLNATQTDSTITFSMNQQSLVSNPGGPAGGTVTVPEPSAVALLGLGIVGLILGRRRAAIRQNLGA